MKYCDTSLADICSSYKTRMTSDCEMTPTNTQLVVRPLLCLQLVAQLGDGDVGSGHGCGPGCGHGRTRIGAVTIVRRVRQLLVHPYAFQGLIQRHNGPVWRAAPGSNVPGSQHESVVDLGL